MNRVWMAPGGMVIVPAQVADAPAMARLHAGAFYRGWSAAEFEAFMIAGETPAYVARDARQRVLGFAILRLSADEVELLTIAVDPKARRKGLGDALMRAAFDDLLTSRAKRMFLEVAEDNVPALKLYRRHGFADVGKRQGYYPRPDGTPATALVMARDLV